MSRAGAARRVWAIVPAAGRGERFEALGAARHSQAIRAARGRNRARMVAARAADASRASHGIVVVLAAGRCALARAVARRLDSPKLLTTIGGASRQDSVMNGLEVLERAARRG